jgi:hypothetical protein
LTFEKVWRCSPGAGHQNGRIINVEGSPKMSPFDSCKLKDMLQEINDDIKEEGKRTGFLALVTDCALLGLAGYHQKHS